MNVISRPTLEEFAEDHADARDWLSNWWLIASKAKWKSLAEIRRTYPATDQFGGCLIFNCKGNDYRFIVGVSYATDIKNGTLFIKHFLTHGEYDRDHWKESCS